METLKQPAQLIRRAEVERKTGLARSTIYELVKDGRFPAPIELTGRTRCWVASDVDAWVQSRIDAARGGSAEAKA